MWQKQRWVLLVVLTAAALAGGTAWLRLTRVTEEGNPTEYWRRQGAAAYARMRTASIADEASIRGVIDTAPVEDPDGRLRGHLTALDSLRTTATELLLARFNSPSPDQYVQWMESEGYRFRTRTEFEQRHGPLSRLAGYIDLDAEVATPQEVFAKLWTYPPALAATPDALCADTGSSVIAIGIANHNQFFSGNIIGELGYDLWHGGSSARCRMWMKPPVSREELIARHGEVLAAQVGIIAAVPGSGRRPIIVSAYFDDATSRWWVDEVSVTNYSGTDEAWTGNEY